MQRRMMVMFSRRRHSPQEIASKLHQANELLQAGKRQAEIARELGISVMTYHRWRAAARAAVNGPSIAPEISDLAHSPDSVQDLQLENARFRRLIIDLLMEKMRLEEQLGDRL
jgi:putative transposase